MTGSGNGNSKQKVSSIRIVQVGQLRQRDRAAGRVSYGQKSKTGTGRQYLTINQSINQSINRGFI